MATMLYELRVEMEDGTIHDVVVTQHDIARWELQDFGTSFSEMHTRMVFAYRWLAWHNLQRHGKTNLSWDEFDNQCAEVLDTPDEESALPADADNPGQTVPSA